MNEMDEKKTLGNFFKLGAQGREILFIPKEKGINLSSPLGRRGLHCFVL
jgi:hypothetical protein